MNEMVLMSMAIVRRLAAILSFPVYRSFITEINVTPLHWHIIIPIVHVTYSRGHAPAQKLFRCLTFVHGCTTAAPSAALFMIHLYLAVHDFL